MEMWQRGSNQMDEGRGGGGEEEEGGGRGKVVGKSQKQKGPERMWSESVCGKRKKERGGRGKGERKEEEEEP